MEILVASGAGFCFGVKRAINMAKKCAVGSKTDIYTYGPIIHNPQVVKKLEGSQIYTRESLEGLDGETVIIRSHGAKSEDFDIAGEKGIRVVDATCPFVKKTQDLVAELTRDGYSVILVGEKNHPEVRGLISYGSGDILVASGVEELRGVKLKKKLGIVAQTTISVTKLQEVANFCLTRASEVKVYNTICDATSIRQSESEEIARHVDCMIVVGGRNSANTNRLAELCRAIQPVTHHIEVADEVDEAWFKGIKRVGITGGASTPSWLIEEVLARVGAAG